MLKNWKKSDKYKTQRHTIYSNTLPEYKGQNSYYVTVAEIGDTAKFYVSVTKGLTEILNKDFPTFDAAFSFAKEYMLKNTGEDNMEESSLSKTARRLLGESVIEEAVNIDKQIEKIASMTDDNYHQEAKLELAKILGNKKAENILKHIIAIHEIEGSLPSELSTYSSNILKDLLKDAKEKFDVETYSKLHGAF